MSGKGNLVFDFFNVYEEKLDDKVDVTLTHLELSDTRHTRNHSGKNSLRAENLHSTHGGIYKLQVFPVRYRPVGRFVRVIEGKTVRHAIILPVEPDRVIRPDFVDYELLGDDLKRVLEASSVEGLETFTGAGLFGELDDFRKAGLLNIYAKMKRTKFPNGRDAFSYVSSMTRIRAQRFFARVQKELRDEVKNSMAANLFNEASGALHTPPPEFSSAGSFKTPERHGNLQLTFFCNHDTLDFMIDADIDDAQGIGHIFQVLRPVFTGQNTNPYDIHEILLAYQKIDPMYTLVV